MEEPDVIFWFNRRDEGKEQPCACGDDDCPVNKVASTGWVADLVKDLLRGGKSGS